MSRDDDGKTVESSGAARFIDAVIHPHETRPKLIQALLALDAKIDHKPPREHGNIPLQTAW